jgi:hypothetical protein
MLDTMERIRLIIDTTEELRLAVKLAAIRAGKGTSELVNEILTKALKDELKDAAKYARRDKE